MPFIVRPFDCVNKSQPRDIRQAEIIGIVIVVRKPDEIEPDIAGELPYGFGIERAIGSYGMYMQVAEEQVSESSVKGSAFVLSEDIFSGASCL